MTCKKCGKDIPQSAKICPNCGEEVQELENEKKEETIEQNETVNEEVADEQNESEVEDQVKVDVNDYELNFNEQDLNTSAKKSGNKKLWIGIGIGAIIVAIAALLFFNSEFYAFTMIKNNPVKAYSKAVSKQNDLKKISTGVNMSMDAFAGQNEQKISIQLDSKQDKTNKLYDTNMKMSTQQALNSISLAVQMYQKNHDSYIKVPNDKRYIVVKNYDKNNDSNIIRELSGNFIKIMERNVLQKNIATKNSSIKINGKNIKVVKIDFKITDSQSKNIIKEIMKSIYVDSYIQNNMMTGNGSTDSKKLQSLLDAQLDNSLKQLNVNSTTYSVYIDKDGYIRDSKFSTEVQDMTTGTSKFIFSTDNLLKAVKDDVKVEVPTGIEKKSIDSADIKKNPKKYKDVLQKISNVSGSSASK